MTPQNEIALYLVPPAISKTAIYALEQHKSLVPTLIMYLPTTTQTKWRRRRADRTSVPGYGKMGRPFPVYGYVDSHAHASARGSACRLSTGSAPPLSPHAAPGPSLVSWSILTTCLQPQSAGQSFPAVL